jgi:hypothetical protein
MLAGCSCLTTSEIRGSCSTGETVAKRARSCYANRRGRHPPRTEAGANLTAKGHTCKTDNPRAHPEHRSVPVTWTNSASANPRLETR